MVRRTRRYGLLEQYRSLKRNYVSKISRVLLSRFLDIHLTKFDKKIVSYSKPFKTPKRKLFSQANSVKDYVGVLS